MIFKTTILALLTILALSNHDNKMMGNFGNDLNDPSKNMSDYNLDD